MSLSQVLNLATDNSTYYGCVNVIFEVKQARFVLGWVALSCKYGVGFFLQVPMARANKK